MDDETPDDEAPELDLKDKPDDELRQLALDLNAGIVFTDRQCDSMQDVASTFMPVGLGALNGVPEETVKKIGLIYEYKDEAGPLSVNGRPIFLSMQMLNAPDTEKVIAYSKKLSDHEDEFVKEAAK